MRNFFRRLRNSFRRRTTPRKSPTRRMRESSGAQMAVNMAAADGSRQRYQSKSALGRAASDFAMDIGAKKKDNQYYANLPKRQEASQKALADMRRRRKKRNDKKADDTTDTTTETTETTTTADDTTNTNTTTLDENTNTALTNVEDISDRTFNNTDNITNYFDNTATSLVNTAAGQEQNQASALTTSVGEAEDEAISYMTTGTASNVLNPGGAQGLLGGDDDDEDDPFNRRKTLIGA